MDRKIALLRAVNVGGRKLPMAQLRELAASLGWDEVETFIQSGNLLFRAAGEEAELEAMLERALNKALGFEVPVLVRSASAWAALIAANPFPQAAANSPAKLLLYLSKSRIAADAAAILAEYRKAGEQLEVAGDGLWCLYAEGVGVSNLTPARIDRACGSPATGRNFRTLLAIQQRLLS